MVDTFDTTDNTGTLTSTTITGLGMAVGITYGTIEHLVISLGSGDDTFTIESTHGAATSPFQETTAQHRRRRRHGPDQQPDRPAGCERPGGYDTINMNGAGPDSASTLNGDAGDDFSTLNTVIGTVTVNGGNDADTVNMTT